jgi:hypothetical protein
VAKNLEKECIAVEKMGKSSDWIRILMFYRHVPNVQLAAGIKFNFWELYPNSSDNQAMNYNSQSLIHRKQSINIKPW